MKFINLLLTAGLLCFGFVQAQVSSNSSGGEATGSGGTVAYSIGQVFTRLIQKTQAV